MAAQVVESAWTAAAGAYAATWAPRFAPWVSEAVQALAAAAAAVPAGEAAPPPGHVRVLGCGPGSELPALAAACHRDIHATDLSPAMVDLARHATAHLAPRVRVEVGDARAAAAAAAAAAAGTCHSLLFSAFLLQALPARLATLGAWVGALPPGGLAAVLWWPPPAGQSDAAWGAVTAGPPAGGGGTDDARAVASAVAHAGGGVVLSDTSPVHAMHFPSRAALAEALVRGGPLTVAAAVDGEAARARAAAAAELAAEEGDGRVVLRPSARLVVVRKAQGQRVGTAAAAARL